MKKRMPLAFWVSCLFLAGCGGFSESDWKRVSAGTSGLSFESPGKLSSMTVNLSPQARFAVNKMENYQFASGNFEIAVSYAEYISSIRANVQGAAKGGMDSLSQTSGVSGLKYDTAPLNKFGMDGLSITGTFEKGGSRAGIQAAVFTKENRLYQVMVIYKYADPKLAAAAKRVVESVQIQ